MLDISGLIPEARPVVKEAAAVYLRHTTPWFVGLVAHGSAVKGGFIPGCSDIDLQLYLEDSAFSWHEQLPLELGFSVRSDLAEIDPTPFRYIQCYARTRKQLEGLVGPIPGAYYVVAGELPVAEATAQELYESARRGLAELSPAPQFIIGPLLGHGGVRLARSIRLLCTKVWPVLYQVLTLQGDDVIGVWCLSKDQAIGKLPKGSAMSRTIQRFYQAVRGYYPAEDSLEGAFSVIGSGIAFLEAAKSWWQEDRAEQSWG